MSEMIERVVRAIAACNTAGGEETARAAIEAMREPTEEQLCAANEIDNGWGSVVGEGAGADVWRAMIDAALKD